MADTLKGFNFKSKMYWLKTLKKKFNKFFNILAEYKS